MSFVVIAPEALAAAAADVAGIGSSVGAATASAAVPTTLVVAAAGDEVSTAVASLFSGHAREFQALSARAAEFHSQFVEALIAGAGAYASTEAANAGPLQTLEQDLPVPNVAVSVGGFNLLQLGSATASSNLGGIAIAFGPKSDATVNGGLLTSAVAIGGNSRAESGTGGILDTATAFGANSKALSEGGFDNLATAVGTNSFAETVTGSNNDLATAVGTNSVAVSTNGYLNMASAFGTNSAAYTENGNLDTAITSGAHSTASAVNGSFDFADALGPGSTAFAGGTSSTALGSSNLASVLGAGSTAHAGASPTTGGNGDLAAAFGNVLGADATGGNVLIDFVTPIFNATP